MNAFRQTITDGSRRWASPLLLGVLLQSACGNGGEDTPSLCDQAEVCDGVDNDCDGSTDEGVNHYYYLDEDGDGYGQFHSQPACEAPKGWVLESGDCNDGDPQIHPDQTETCDQIDQDCDVLVDETAFTTFYADQDDDGFGDPTMTTHACTAPNGFTTNALDCDDDDGDIYPEGEEVCDGQDQDCDGVIDEGQMQSAGWIHNICNPIDLAAEDTTLSDAGFVSGLDLLPPVDDALHIYEDPSVDEGDQQVVLHGFPAEIRGHLSATGHNGLAFTGDMDGYHFTAPYEGQATFSLAMDGGGPGEFFIYDVKSESYSGPYLSGQDVIRSVAAGAEYIVSIAARSGDGDDYRLRIAFDGNQGIKNTRYRLYYSAQNIRDGSWIGTAVSEDGITWIPAKSPVLEGDACIAHASTAVAQPTVVEDGGLYHMWFQVSNDNNRPIIGYATSFDGYQWICSSDGIWPQGDDEDGLWHPTVRKGQDGLWRLFFGISSGGCGEELCDAKAVALATSATPGDWQRVEGAQTDLIVPGDDELGTLQGQQLVEVDGGWLHVFSLFNRGTSVVYAGQSDGMSWPTDPPLSIKPISTDSWEPDHLVSPVGNLRADGTLELWFHGESALLRTGHAWRPDAKTLLFPSP